MVTPHLRDERLRVCVVGSGGREHALAVALARTAKVIVAPGNPAMTAPGISLSSAPATEVDADLYVIGPEAPLVDGLADRLRAQGRAVFGPGADGARLEGSKAWMKDLLAAAGVPTAAYGTFEEVQPAVELLRSLPTPYVIKTDGLAAGKGVLVTWSIDEAIADVEAKLSGAAFGPAGRRVVIEEGLSGRELSVMAICDGTRALALAPAQDHKRLGDGDTGPNTGGMGAYSPVPGVGPDMVAEVMARAVVPTLRALSGRGIDYRGVLYAGIMVTPNGPRVLEFNVRFGDPETQVVLPRWQGDVAAVLAAAAAGRLDLVDPPKFGNDAAVCVVLAAGGYPQAPVTGDPIDGMDVAAAVPGVAVYAAGVAYGPSGWDLVTAGGRVLGVTGTGHSLSAARQRAYQAVDAISWPAMVFRGDIAAAHSPPQPGVVNQEVRL
ncbi:MAG: phosphoribosylamine--glycine ligase [Actinomycetota bacterium]|nr:phosphoribosylamine--glycine ligase [Actinomycetota bacterium]